LTRFVVFHTACVHQYTPLHIMNEFLLLRSPLWATMMPRHERTPMTGIAESDTAALVALYSALIQGGATILAVIGGFLLTFGPVSRSRLIRYEQLQREAQRSMAEQMALARNLGEATRRRGEQLDVEQFEEEVSRAAEKVLAHGSRFQSAVELSVQEKKTIQDEQRSLWAAAAVLTIVAAFCVVIPAFLLSFLGTDPDADFRSKPAVAGYGIALLFLAEGVIMLTREHQPSHRRGFGLWTIVLLLMLVFCLISIVAIGYIPAW
jgi:hypothetical protein